MNILNSKETLVKDQFSYFKINSIGSVTGYDAINLPDGMTIYKPDGYIYGTPTKQQTKSSVFLAKSRDENIYKIVELQVIDTNEIPFSIPNTLNDSSLKIASFVSPSGQAINLNLNNTLSGYYKNSDSFLNSTISGVPIYSTISQNVTRPLNFYGISTASFNAIQLNNNLSGVSGVSIGSDHALALFTSKRITGWGDNAYSQALGGNNLTGAKAISAGGNHSLALLDNLRVTGWGYNIDGQALGGNNLTGVMQIAAGYGHSLALLDTKKITGWGDNTYGQALGGNNLTGVIQIAAGRSHSLALLQNNQVTGWGLNTSNQALGGNSLTGVIKISASVDTSMALFNNGGVINWGDGNTVNLCYFTGIYAPTGANGNPVVIPTGDGVTQPVNPADPINCNFLDLNCNANNAYQIITGFDQNNCPMYGCTPCPPPPTCSNSYLNVTGYDQFGCRMYTCTECEPEIPIIDEANSFDFISYEGAGNITIDLFPRNNWISPIPQLIWGDATPLSLSPAESIPVSYLGTKTQWTLSHIYKNKIINVPENYREIIGYDSNNCAIYGPYNYKIILNNERNVNLADLFPFTPQAGDRIVFEVQGNIGGSAGNFGPSIDTGPWPAGTVLRLIVPSVKGSDACNPYEGVVAGMGNGYCYFGAYRATNAILIRNGVNLIIENHGKIGGGGKQGYDNPCCCGEGGGGAGIPGGQNNGGGGKSCCGGEGPGSILCGGGGGGGGGAGGGLSSGASAVVLQGNGTYSFAPESTRPYFE